MFRKMMMILLCLALLLPTALAEENTLRVMLAGGWLEADGYTGARLDVRSAESITDEMANAFAIRNDQIDLFVFPAYEGLYSIKTHGYYAPLNDSAVLMGKLGDLYPAFQQALTDDGKLVGWVMSADVMGMMVHHGLLRECGLPVPDTFDELLDTCQAVLEADVLPLDESLLGTAEYSQQGVLDLYMEQYIRACQLGGGTVSFTAPEFLAMVRRIQAELPATDPFPGDWAENSVFEFDLGYMLPEADMVIKPRVVEGRPHVIETQMMVAVVNPYSANQEGAVAFLEWYAAQVRPENYIFDASLGLMESDWDKERIAVLQADIAELEAAPELSPEQEIELEAYRLELASREENPWVVSEAAIDFYASLADGLSITEASPVTYDSALRTAAQRFLNGAYDAEGFAQACQEHITMIYQENNIPMN